MKKLVAILIAAIMLVSFVPNTFAAPTAGYYADMNGSFSGTTLNDSKGVFTRYKSEITPGIADKKSVHLVEGNLAQRKNADDHMLMAQIIASSGNDYAKARLTDASGNSNFSYTGVSGDKVYGRAQYYIPSKNQAGQSLNDYSDDFKCAMYIGVDGYYAPQYSSPTSEHHARMVTMHRTGNTGGKFYLFHSSTELSDQSWEYDTWYTVETIVTLGNPAKISVYVNGEPLSFSSGSNATSENVSLGVESYKVTSFKPFFITGAYQGINNPKLRQMFTDNWGFETYAANASVDRWTPPVYNPIAFDGFTDGSKIDIKSFTEATVTVGSEECTEVSLFVNGESLGTLTAPPYTFNIPSGVELGNATIKAIAKTATETYERSVNVVLTEIYDRKSMKDNMESYGTFRDMADGGWYEPSSRFSLDGLVPNGWFMKPEVVEDKAKKSYGKAAMLGCDPNSGEFYYTENGVKQNSDIKFGYQKLNGANSGTVSGYSATLDWQMYVDNANMDETNVEPLKLTMGQKLFSWDATEQKLKWNVKGDPVYTTVNFKYWQHYAVNVNMTGPATKISLYIDGETIFEDAELASAISSFNNVVWYFDPDHTLGNYIAVDEVTLTHHIPRPSFGEATFYRGGVGNTDLENISPLTDTITIDMGKDLLPNMLEQNVEFYKNGELLTFVDDEGETKDTLILLRNGLLYLVPPCPLQSDTEYSVVLRSDALFADETTIGYDQTFTFTTSKADIDVMDVTYYKNGEKITDLSTVTFARDDKIKAKVTVCNNNTLDENIYVMLLGYNNTRLAASDITYVTAVAQKADNVFETAEITITDPAAFSAAVSVWNSDFLPIANVNIASGNQ